MALSLAPKQDDINTELKSFLGSILPTKDIEIFVGQDNRVPEPSALDFVVFTPLRQRRIETNIDSFDDVEFIASILLDDMTVTELNYGVIKADYQVFGVGVAENTYITEQISGTPGAEGVYKLNVSQTVASEIMASGGASVMQPTEITLQIDIHGPESADNAQIISTLFRDGFAADYFLRLGSAISPLIADDPKQMPFINAEQQYENRWVVEAQLQANQIVTQIPQQFAASLDIDLINVDVTYPPS